MGQTLYITFVSVSNKFNWILKLLLNYLKSGIIITFYIQSTWQSLIYLETNYQ